MNAAHLRAAAAALDARAEESTRHAPRQLGPFESPPRYYLADCMRHLADAIGERELTRELFDEVLPTLPNVFCAQTQGYGPKDRAASYADAVRAVEAEVGA